MAYVICSDDIKQTLPGYDPARAGEFHDKSTKLADVALGRALKTRPEKTVILMSGGSASGKSEYVSVYLSRREVIVSDGTCSNLKRAEGKIQKAQAAGKQVAIYAVWPADLSTAFEAFIGRERQFDARHFYRTHSKSRQTLLQIAQSYPDIPITLIISDYETSDGGPKMIFGEYRYESREDLVEYIAKNQYTESKIQRTQKTYEP